MSRADFVSMFELDIVGSEGKESVMCEVEAYHLSEEAETELNVTYIEEPDKLDMSESLLQTKVEKKVDDQKTMLVQNLLNESQRDKPVDKVTS